MNQLHKGKLLLFPLGDLVATPAALSCLENCGVIPMRLIARHGQGDWGGVSPLDVQANVDALSWDGRLLSSYTLAGDTKIWVITEADRSATTILLPSEYLFTDNKTCERPFCVGGVAVSEKFSCRLPPSPFCILGREGGTVQTSEEARSLIDLKWTGLNMKFHWPNFEPCQEPHAAWPHAQHSAFALARAEGLVRPLSS